MKNKSPSTSWFLTSDETFFRVFDTSSNRLLPWVPEVFLACGGNFRFWPKADTSSAVSRSHETALEKCLAPRVIGCHYLEKCLCILFMFTVKPQPTNNSDPVIGHQTCSPGYFTTETFYFYRPVQTRNLITGR